MTEIIQRRLSRRAILKLPVLASVVATASPLLACKTIDCDSQVAKNLNDLCKLPEKEWNDVLTHALGHGLQSAKQAHFKVVAQVLWKHLLVGAGDKDCDQVGEGGGVTIPDAALWWAYDYKSGPHIIDHVNQDDFPPSGSDIETNVCAFKCGEYAAAEAGAGKPISLDDLKAGWELTKSDAEKRKGRLQRRTGATPPTVGFGC